VGLGLGMFKMCDILKAFEMPRAATSKLHVHCSLDSILLRRCDLEPLYLIAHLTLVARLVHKVSLIR
jgi:hypothetical protein